MISFEQLFKMDSLSCFIGLFVLIFSLLIILYSFGFMRGRKKLGLYYLDIVLTLLSSLGAVFANNLILFVVFWGVLGLLLYLLIYYGQKENTANTAKKALPT